MFASVFFNIFFISKGNDTCIKNICFELFLTRFKYSLFYLLINKVANSLLLFEITATLLANTRLEK